MTRRVYIVRYCEHVSKSGRGYRPIRSELIDFDTDEVLRTRVTVSALERFADSQGSQLLTKAECEHLRAARARFEKLRRIMIEEAAGRGEPMVFGIPESWYSAKRWACMNGHSSGGYLGEGRGPVCPVCEEPVRRLPFASDNDLAAALAAVDQAPVPDAASEA
jgi:hypothetical protein